MHGASPSFPAIRLAVVVLALLFSVAAGSPAAGQLTDTGVPEEGLSPERAKALADLLGDDKARQAIIQELQGIAEQTQAESPAPAAEQAPQDESFVRSIAETTQSFAEGFAGRMLLFWEQLKNAPRALKAIQGVSPEIVIDAVADLLLLMVTTIVLFLVLRWAAKRLYWTMGEAAQQAGAFRTGLIFGASVLIDAGVVIIAWAAGYLLTLLVFGDLGDVGIRQTLYLNAFLTVEMVKVIIRALLSPASADLRLIALPDKGARTLSRWLNVSVSLIGYGQMLVVPIVNQNVSFFAGRAVSTILSLLTVAILIGLVLAHRRAVSHWLRGERRLEHRSAVSRFLARYWHVPVVLYLVSLFAIVLARPGGILLPLLIISGQVLAAGVIGMVVANFLKRAMSRGVRLPGTINERLPLLERRLNGLVPQLLGLLRLLIIAAVVAFTVDAIGLLNVEEWITSEIGARWTGTLISVLFILLAAFAVSLALSSWIDYRLNPQYGTVATSRERTLLTLLRNAATIVLIVITLMFVLSEIGIDIAPLIASAGVLGLAIGFGAQKMVQDIITGVFIQFENAINVGDVVTVGGMTGTVERLTIRSVSLRDLQGVFHIIPFSSVDMVSNYMREFAYFLCDMGIAYRESVADAKQAMLDAFDELRANPERSPAILGDLEWFGLQAFGDSAVVVRARIKCAPGQQWGIGRAYNEIVKRIFDERGIEIPFPHQTLYFGEDKDGKAPPLRVVARRRQNEPPETEAKETEQQHAEAPADGSPGPESSKIVPDEAHTDR